MPIGHLSLPDSIPGIEHLHPDIIHEIESIDRLHPRNALEWMFGGSRRSGVAVPAAKHPRIIATAFRRQLTAVYDTLPPFAREYTPILIHFSSPESQQSRVSFGPRGRKSARSKLDQLADVCQRTPPTVTEGVAGTVRWSSLDDQTVRNVAVWLYGIKDLLEKKSFAEFHASLATRFAESKRDSGVGLEDDDRSPKGTARHAGGMDVLADAAVKVEREESA